MPSKLMLIISTLFLPISNSMAFDYNTLTPPPSVLRFQQKMASKGYANFQYKLGRMHESGVGAKKDINTAKIWYEKAASQQHKPARNRLIFLDIKSNGYIDTHKNWLK